MILKQCNDEKMNIRTEALQILFWLGLGAALSLTWGMLSSLLHLEKIFPDTVQRQMFEIPFMLQLLLYGLVSPVTEELFFRKLFFDFVRRYVPEYPSMFITAGLFALWHGNLFQMLYAFPMGLLLQFLRKKSGKMKAPILCHMGSNLAAVLVETYFGG